MPCALHMRAACVGAIGLVAAASPAPALQINLFERGAGESFQSFSRGSAEAGPGASAGGGTLFSVVSAAADYWSDVILSPGTLNVEFGWQTLGGSTLAVASQTTRRSYDGAGKTGLIRFGAGTDWFVDPTPLDAGEYAFFDETLADLGAGPMVTGREAEASSGPAFGLFDLFGVALHELGHLLGLADLGESVFDDGSLDVTRGDFAGATISLTETGGGHLDGGEYDAAAMQPTMPRGLRRLASDADVAAIQELSGFDSVDYAAAAAVAPVPLPGALALLLTGGGALVLAGRRRAA